MKGAKFMQAISNSSNIAALDVEGDDLLVEFKTGRKYRYAGLGYSFDALVSEATRPNGSVGKLFNTVKVGYDYEEVTE